MTTVPARSEQEPPTTTPETVNRHYRRHPEAPPLAYGMAEAADLAGLSRSHLYAEAAAGRLVTRKVGRRRLVLARDLGAWLDNLPSA